MIIEGTAPGDTHPDEHELDFSDVTWCMHDLGHTTGPDFQTLACRGDTVRDGTEAVREGLITHLLAFKEFTEITGVKFTRAERTLIEQTRVEALEADEPGPMTAEFPGEFPDD
ncbi:hypothetical protein [Deinococcus soli (ex Cha et al. 2016)]|uniref:Uncharacterized protein n=2 Tax=Deinococcus soli (ex Cha et al. 2016) TaxID=1309411 RepID=A0AAE3XD52_9DEIO|nr:hypothetical protein [Deinococcus soli (ex Cha et al. 2016)]MDR6218866.1 hypothetical protein [Deinococcus soli (ex Cha et al. 2016)]MDR6328663.1 hypothetical protein [Deinococcus soli (ex Cha et al. 2016)]MDR6751850.1 hypothetical protein [Deinococcus soli (ex Cha et al. 2016)]